MVPYTILEVMAGSLNVDIDVNDHPRYFTEIEIEDYFTNYVNDITESMNDTMEELGG